VNFYAVEVNFNALPVDEEYQYFISFPPTSSCPRTPTTASARW
jgi:hypothetical protein